MESKIFKINNLKAIYFKEEEVETRIRKQNRKDKMGMSSLSITMIIEKMIKKTFTHLTVLWFKLELFKKLIWWHIKLGKVEIFRWLTS